MMNGAPRHLVYAGFWIRLWASVIDSAIVMALLYPLLAAVYGSSYWSDRLEVFAMLRQALQGRIGVEALQSLPSLESGPLDFVFSYLLPAAAVVLFWIYRSATPGKMAVHASIVDADTGGAPSSRQLVIRYFGYFLSLFPFGAGFLWILLDSRKQGWHDKLANTVVVRRVSSGGS